MTDRTAAILNELRRITGSSEATSLPLVGTGLRASEVLDWLRAMPDDAGADELVARLDQRERDALADYPDDGRPSVEAPRPPYTTRRERWWPTQSLLDAGTDLMIEEWDPFGMRLGGVERETIAMFVFHFFGPQLAPNVPVDPITHTTEMIASAERDRLGLSPTPKRHRRYLALRLRSLLEQYPVPPVKEWPPQAQVVVVVGDDAGPPPLDPEGVCVRCHSFGTVARMTLLSTPPTITRYCAACSKAVRAESSPSRRKGPESAAEQIARLDRMHRPAMSWDSRSWDDTLELVQRVTGSDGGDDQPTDAARMATFAEGLWKIEDRMDGPMPPEVEAFARRYAPHASPP